MDTGINVFMPRVQGFEEWCSDGCALMQYTGLKDKNGVEVYEGDLVNSEHILENMPGNPKKITFSSGAFWCGGVILNAYTWPHPDFPVGTCPTVEVIGNIYENPELLEKQ